MGVRELKHEAQVRDWREKVMECRSSGMSVKKWCEERRVDRKTYYRWEKEEISYAVVQVSDPNGLKSPFTDLGIS